MYLLYAKSVKLKFFSLSKKSYNFNFYMYFIFNQTHFKTFIEFFPIIQR